MARGAVALLVQRPLDLPVPQVVADDPRAAMAIMAARLAGDPSHHMQVVGITGTNGKTTCAYLMQSVLRATGRPCGLIGTVEVVVGGAVRGGAIDIPVLMSTAQVLFTQSRTFSAA